MIQSRLSLPQSTWYVIIRTRRDDESQAPHFHGTHIYAALSGLPFYFFSFAAHNAYIRNISSPGGDLSIVDNRRRVLLPSFVVNSSIEWNTTMTQHWPPIWPLIPFSQFHFSALRAMMMMMISSIPIYRMTREIVFFCKGNFFFDDYWMLLSTFSRCWPFLHPCSFLF